MPHTSYALFKAIRSHRIDSPSAANSQRTGRPNACNQCHLDRSLAWTARHLTDWYGAASVEFDRDDNEIAASALWVLKGDAVQRAVTAWSLAWQPAVSTSGNDWQPPLLAQLLEDPYSAVRFVAYQSLKQFPGYEDFEFDFVASAAMRKQAKQTAVEIWRRDRGDAPEREDGRVLIGPDGRQLEAEVRRLLNLRDDRPLQLPE